MLASLRTCQNNALDLSQAVLTTTVKIGDLALFICFLPNLNAGHGWPGSAKEEPAFVAKASSKMHPFACEKERHQVVAAGLLGLDCFANLDALRGNTFLTSTSRVSLGSLSVQLESVRLQGAHLRAVGDQCALSFCLRSSGELFFAIAMSI